MRKLVLKIQNALCRARMQLFSRMASKSREFRNRLFHEAVLHLYIQTRDNWFGNNVAITCSSCFSRVTYFFQGYSYPMTSAVRFGDQT